MGEEKKPWWEERWFTWMGYICRSEKAMFDPIIEGAATSAKPIAQILDKSREALILSAPDMARLLLSFEWCGNGGIDGCSQCPSCLEPEPEETCPTNHEEMICSEGLVFGHAADCEWLRVMKKAGLR